MQCPLIACINPKVDDLQTEQRKQRKMRSVVPYLQLAPSQREPFGQPPAIPGQAKLSLTASLALAAAARARALRANAVNLWARRTVGDADGEWPECRPRCTKDPLACRSS
jgi:hypothetical protein